MIGVWVEYVETTKENLVVDYDWSPGWRISFRDDDGEWFSLSTRFERKADADAALAYMEKHGLTRRDFIDAPADGSWEWKKRMLEALQW